jgi:hypothetical protein
MTQKVSIIILSMITVVFGCNSIDRKHIQKEAILQYNQCIRFYNNHDTLNYLKYVHPKIRPANQKYFFDSIKHKSDISDLSELFIKDSIYQFSFKEIVNSKQEVNDVIAISYNYGENWYFFNVFNSVKKMSNTIPDLDERLPIKFNQSTEFKF